LDAQLNDPVGENQVRPSHSFVLDGARNGPLAHRLSASVTGARTTTLSVLDPTFKVKVQLKLCLNFFSPVYLLTSTEMVIYAAGLLISVSDFEQGEGAHHWRRLYRDSGLAI
jgi:hypothetical protein